MIPMAVHVSLCAVLVATIMAGCLGNSPDPSTEQSGPGEPAELLSSNATLVPVGQRVAAWRIDFDGQTSECDIHRDLAGTTPWLRHQLFILAELANGGLETQIVGTNGNVLADPLAIEAHVAGNDVHEVPMGAQTWTHNGSFTIATEAPMTSMFLLSRDMAEDAPGHIAVSCPGAFIAAVNATEAAWMDLVSGGDGAGVAVAGPGMAASANGVLQAESSGQDVVAGIVYGDLLGVRAAAGQLTLRWPSGQQDVLALPTHIAQNVQDVGAGFHVHIDGPGHYSAQWTGLQLKPTAYLQFLVMTFDATEPEPDSM